MDRIEFRFSESTKPVFWQRGDPNHSFFWTEVPQAIALLFLDYGCWELPQSTDPFFFSGAKKDSLAASLGDALHQPKHRIQELFVDTSSGGGTVGCWRKIFGGDNVHGKSPRDRRISVRSDFLPQDCLEFFWDSRGPLQMPGDLRGLAQRIRKSLELAPAKGTPKPDSTNEYIKNIKQLLDQASAEAEIEQNDTAMANYKSILNHVELLAINNFDKTVIRLCGPLSGFLGYHDNIEQEGLAQFEKEWELLSVTVDLSLSEQEAVINDCFQKRSEGCRQLVGARKLLLDTLSEIKRVNDKKRLDYLKSPPPTMTAKQIAKALRENDETIKRFERERAKIERVREEVDYLETMVVKKIRRVSIVDFENKRVRVDDGFWNANMLVADRDVVKENEIFSLFELGDGKIVLMGNNKLVVSADRHRSGQLISDRHCPLSWERFEIRDAGAGYVNILDSSGKYVSSRLDEGKLIKACAVVASKWELFRIETQIGKESIAIGRK